MLKALYYATAQVFLRLTQIEVARSRWCDRRADAALARAEVWTRRARAAAERLDRARRASAPVPSGDLLYGSRAIAAHLGIPKGATRHLIRSGQIPWFALGGVACARRSTLAAHFAALEIRSRV